MSAWTMQDLATRFPGRLGLAGACGIGFSARPVLSGSLLPVDPPAPFPSGHAEGIPFLSPDGMSGLHRRPRPFAHRLFRTIARSGAPGLLLAASHAIPPLLARLSRRFHVPVLASSLEAPHLESRLVGLLREHRDGTIRVHACLAVTSGRGILITGESGTGKTSAALRLAGEAGGAWIADDAVELFLREGSVRGSAPVRTRGLVDLPGRGILRAAALLVPERILEEAGVDGVVRVVRRSSDPPPEWPEVTRRGTCRILGLERPFQVFATEEGCEPLERRIAGWASSLDPRRREA